MEIVVASGDLLRNESGWVGGVDRAVVGIGIRGPLLWIGEIHERVDGDEPAKFRVVLSCAEVGQARRVGVATDETFLVRPRWRCAASGAVGRLSSCGDGLGGAVGVDGEVLAALVVGVQPVQVVEGGAGAGRDELSGEAVVASEGDGGGAGGSADLGAGQVERGAGGVASDEAGAVGVVDVGVGAGACGGAGQVAFGVPGEGLARTGAGVAGIVVGVCRGGGATRAPSCWCWPPRAGGS